MIAYQFITALSDAKPRSHLIARVSCAQLPQTALVAEMRDSDGIADTCFGCAPFARITLLPDALWHDALTEGLLAALRPLFASPVSADIVLDVTDIDEVVLAQVLRFLFNQAHRLSDLQLKKPVSAFVLSTSPPSACRNSRRSWKQFSASSRPSLTAWSQRVAWRIYRPIAVRRSLWSKRRKNCVPPTLPCAARC